jgi:DNA-binding protein HU-beta
MTKSQLTEIVAKKAHLTKKAATEAVDTFLDEISRQLGKGEKVVLSGFGTFKVKRVKDKKGRNPQTGETIVNRSHRAVRFTVSKVVKQAVK